MDKVRDNITEFIDSIQAGYRFKDKDILEFGCGILDHNKQLFGKDNRFVATDIYMSPAADRIADITDMDTIDSSYDLVIASEVFEHVYDFMAAFMVCKAILRPGGYLLITVPWEYPEHGEDYWRYSERTLDLLLKGFGFDIAVEGRGFDGDKKTNIFRLAQLR